MPLTNAYRDFSVQQTVGEATTAFNNANAHIGVGNGTTAHAFSDTDLVGASKVRRPMDSGYPTRAANVLTFRSTFGTGDANFAWNEWGVFNAATSGTMLNRKVETLGTKPNTQTWQFTVQITFNVA